MLRALTFWQCKISEVWSPFLQFFYHSFLAVIEEQQLKKRPMKRKSMGKSKTKLAHKQTNPKITKHWNLNVKQLPQSSQVLTPSPPWQRWFLRVGCMPRLSSKTPTETKSAALKTWDMQQKKCTERTFHKQHVNMWPFSHVSLESFQLRLKPQGNLYMLLAFINRRRPTPAPVVYSNCYSYLFLTYNLVLCSFFCFERHTCNTWNECL